ncbi:Uncharacterized protein HZ326_26505 [Fusarium oxysporum f. sp. albedinis]|nr:Uncharacterized protein HZ326_26505 [Fusarium oxysporum f. sp. albedinis]
MILGSSSVMRGVDKGSWTESPHSLQILQAVVHSQPRPKRNKGPGSIAHCGVLSGGDWVLLSWMSEAPCSRYHDEQVAVFPAASVQSRTSKGGDHLQYSGHGSGQSADSYLADDHRALVFQPFPYPQMVLIVNIPQELKPKGPSGTVIIPKSQSKNKKAAASGEANS